MLPLTHSNRSNNRSYNPVGSLLGRSKIAGSKPTRKVEPIPVSSYNSSSRPYYENHPIHLRQQFRPLHEQVTGIDLSNFVVPLALPQEQPYYGSSMSMSAGNQGPYLRNAMHYEPTSPILNQVFTETRHGNVGVCYGVKRKEKRNKLGLIGKVLLIAMGLVAVGLVLHKAIIAGPGPTPIKVLLGKPVNGHSQELEPEPVVEVLDLHHETIMEKVMEPLFEKGVIGAGSGSGAGAKMFKSRSFIFSVNDDYETLVEVVGD